MWMQKFVIALFVLMTSLSFGQDRNTYSLLLGSWEIKAPYDTTTSEYVSFYYKNKYQVTGTSREGKKVILSEGKYHLNHSGTLLTLSENYPDYRYYFAYYPERPSLRVTDSNLFFDQTGRERLSTSLLNIQKSSPFWPFAQPAPANLLRKDTAIWLINSADTTRKRRIAPDRVPILTLHSDTAGTTEIDSQTVELYGGISKYHSDSLTMQLSYESTTIHYKNCYITTITKNYQSCCQEEVLPENKKIAIQTIKTIQYSTRTSGSIYGVAAALCILSGTTALAVAPLVSLNYKNGDFNSAKYKTWAGAGLIGMAVTLPVMYIFREKKYNITWNPALNRANYWYIR